jgi:hypothetical protein
MGKYTKGRVDIEGFEGKYAVTSTGKVYSFYRDIWMTPIDNGGGYLYARLMLNLKPKRYKGFYLHRLVAQHFLPNPENHKYVGHRDHDKTNNDVSNLYWTDASTNTRDGVRDGRINCKGRCGEDGMASHSNEVLSEAYLDVTKNGVGLMEASRKHGVNRTTLASWVKKKSRKDFTDTLD